MDWTLAQGIGGVLGLILALYILAKKLMERYFEKSDQLEAFKAQHNKEVIDEIKKEIAILVNKIQMLENKILEAMLRIKSNQEASKNVLAALENFVNATDKKFRDIENSELLKVGESTWILKRKS